MTEPKTNSQKMAQEACRQIHGHKNDESYTSFAKQFPSLVHSCGLAQAVAFARAKKKQDYLNHLAAVLQAGGHAKLSSGGALEDDTRTLAVSAYIRLSRHALQAAGWLKRYVEAVEEA